MDVTFRCSALFFFCLHYKCWRFGEPFAIRVFAAPLRTDVAEQKVLSDSIPALGSPYQRVTSVLFLFACKWCARTHLARTHTHERTQSHNRNVYITSFFVRRYFRFRQLSHCGKIGISLHSCSMTLGVSHVFWEQYIIDAWTQSPTTKKLFNKHHHWLMYIKNNRDRPTAKHHQ